MKIENKKLHDVEQGTSEWLALREGYCTASKAPDVMGCGYGKTDTESAYLQALFAKGHEAEANIKSSIEADLFNFNLMTAPTITAIVDGVPLLASLDGYCNGIVWECKLADFNAPSKNALSVIAGDVPPIYYWQIQQQLLLAESEIAFLSISDGKKHLSLEVRANKDDQRKLLDAWKRYLNIEARTLAYQYKEIDQQIKTLKDKQDVIRQQLIAASDNQTTDFGTVKVSVTTITEKKQTPSDYVKKNGIALEVTPLEQQEYQFRLTIKED